MRTHIFGLLAASSLVLASQILPASALDLNVNLGNTNTGNTPPAVDLNADVNLGNVGGGNPPLADVDANVGDINAAAVVDLNHGADADVNVGNTNATAVVDLNHGVNADVNVTTDILGKPTTADVNINGLTPGNNLGVDVGAGVGIGVDVGNIVGGLTPTVPGLLPPVPGIQPPIPGMQPPTVPGVRPPAGPNPAAPGGVTVAGGGGGGGVDRAAMLRQCSDIMRRPDTYEVALVALCRQLWRTEFPGLGVQAN